MFYDKFDSINPSPIALSQMDSPIIIQNVAQLTVSYNRHSNSIHIKVTECLQTGDYYFRIQVYIKNILHVQMYLYL